MLELRSLAYFAAACRSETLTEAALALGISVSTLSTRLKGLEEEVGRELFERVSYGLYPTAAARWLLRVADPLLTCERFARRWIGATRARKTTILTVELGLSFTIGGIGSALIRASETFAAERQNVLLDPIWTDEKDLPNASSLAESWAEADAARIFIGLAREPWPMAGKAVSLLRDRWVFCSRFPAGTKKQPSPADLAAGRVVVPALAQPLIEQADRYFSLSKMTAVRFLNEHPGELPRLLDEYPDAASFIPASVASSRLGLLRVQTVAADPPLEIEIAARIPKPNSASEMFLRHLKRALRECAPLGPKLPAVTARQIHYFGLAHRLRRVSAAAQSANVSQPALSEQLRNLERTLTTDLFERRGDGVIPTATGDRFAHVARAIESGLRRIVSEDPAAASPPSRRIAIGILPSVSQHGHLVNRICEAVLGVQERHPDLRLIIQEGPNGTLQDWVMRGLVGVAIVETGLPQMPRLSLGSSEELAAVTHARHGLLPRGPVKFADLAQMRLALPTSRFGLRQLVEAAAEERGIRVQPYIEIDALAMVAAILARAPVVTVLPPSAISRELAAGDLIAHPIIDPTIMRRLFVIYSGERTLSQAERELISTLRARLSETAPGLPS